MSKTQCFYCGGIPVPYVNQDHVLPSSRGGSSRDENLVPACEPCNSSKGSRTPSEWRCDLPDHIYVLERQLLEMHPKFKILPFVPRAASDSIVQLAVHLPDYEREALRRLAASMGVPMSDVVRGLILDALQGSRKAG